MLTRILSARKFGIAPVFVPHAPDLAAMLSAADAALLIGDPALFVDHAALGAAKVDLGDAWTEMTGLPFVWAVWSGPTGAVTTQTVHALNDAARDGGAHLETIADDYCAGSPERRPVARAYLRNNLRFALDARAIEGLRTYFREAASLGLVKDRALEWFA